MRILLVGQLPSGKNQVRTAWTPDKRHPGKMKPHKYPDSRFELWRRDAAMQIVALGASTRMTITAPCRLIIDYWPGDRRTRDLPGMLDALCHLLVYANVLTDDGLIWETVWRRHSLDKQQPRASLELYELNGAPSP